MNNQFIYLLKKYSVISGFTYLEDQFKVGETQDPFHRHQNYGGYYGQNMYDMIFIEILKVLCVIKNLLV